ncbi:MAG: hypothetical protein Kapaf2KO_08250 [Candidatus Kapaibacteriales bacterium]
MAGGGSLGGGSRPKRGKNKKRKQAKRVGFHLDMTPLVDITFLLLTFFMFTTTLTQPSIMDMRLPPELDTPVDVKESELFSLLIAEDGQIYFYQAQEDAAVVPMSDLKAMAVNLNLEVKNRLITVLKSHPKAPYGTLVNVLDELNLAEQRIVKELVKENDPETGLPMQRSRKFTMAKWTEDDQKKIDEAGGGSTAGEGEES